jgi:hypothetical protein
MTTKRLKRPRDPIALAKLIGDIATGQVADAVEDTRQRAAVGIVGAHGMVPHRAKSPALRLALLPKFSR